MTEDDLVKSYLPRPRTARRGFSWRFCIVFLGGPLMLFGGLAAFCVVKSSTPWWIPLLAAILGGILGLFWNRVPFELFNQRRSAMRALQFAGAYLCFKVASDLLAWWAIPHDKSHVQFSTGLLLSIISGWFVVSVSRTIRDFQADG